MNIKFFNPDLIKSGQDVKSQYRDLIKKHHPDIGGNTDDMKVINAEYEFLLPRADKIESDFCATQGIKKTTQHDVNDMYREVIEKIVFLDNISIEIIGSWVWVSGKTYQHYNLFKNQGFVWSKAKKAWYWYKGINTARHFKGHYTLDKLRNMHGSVTVELEKQKTLQAV